MGKNPAFQFYPSDWTRDMDDHDLEIQGAWIAIICRLWWSDTRGEATKTLKEWSRVLRRSEKKSREILNFLLDKGIASGSVLDNQKITIISRKLVEMERISALRREVGKLGGNPKLTKTEKGLDNQTDNQKPTPSSSNLHSSKINYNMATHAWENITDAIRGVWAKAYPYVDIDHELNRAASWLESNPKKQKKDYARFLNNWFSNARPSSGEPRGVAPEPKPMKTIEDLERSGLI